MLLSQHAVNCGRVADVSNTRPTPNQTNTNEVSHVADADKDVNFERELSRVFAMSG